MSTFSYSPTPLLKRVFFVFLALLLLFGCFAQPLRADAYATFDPMSAALWAVLQASDFFSTSAEAAAQILADLIGGISEGVAEEIGPYMALYKVLSRASYGGRISLTDEERAALAHLIFNSPAVRYLLKHKSIDLSDDTLTQDQVPIISAGVQMYVPTEAAMNNIMSITQAQVLYEGFVAIQIQTTQSTNQLLEKINTSIKSLKTTLLAINKSIGTMKNSLKTTLLAMKSSMDEKLVSLKTTLLAFKSSVEDSLLLVRTNLNSINKSVLDAKSELVTALTSLDDSVVSWGASLKTTLLAFKSTVEDSLSLMRTVLNSINKSILDTKAVLQEFVQAFPQDFSDAIADQFPAIEEKLDAIIEKIPVYEDVIVVQKPQIEVEVGAETILVTDYATLNQAFQAKLSWIPQIFNFLRELFNRIIYTGTPPKVPLRLSAATGSIDWGEDTYILDLSWYEPYKPTVDTLVSGILWLLFGWNLYKRVPSILNGIGVSQEPNPSGKGGKK